MGLVRDTPKRSAIRTRSANDRARIFRMMLPRCIFTVTTLILSSAAICLFRSPEVTKPRISFSRAVSDANRLFRTVMFFSSLRHSHGRNRNGDSVGGSSLRNSDRSDGKGGT